MSNTVATRLVFLVAVVLFLGMYAFLKSPTSAQTLHQNQPSLSIARRYQFTVQGNQQFLFDTQTGKLWSRIGTGATNSWEPEASLPSSALSAKP